MVTLPRIHLSHDLDWDGMNEKTTPVDRHKKRMSMNWFWKHDASFFFITFESALQTGLSIV
jgi:hypothetical protein